MRARLPYLASLGVDALWLSPIHPSPNVDWGYDVADYLDVHPDFGVLADYDALVAEARALRPGPGLDPASTMGPLIDERQRGIVDVHVRQAAGGGAEVLTGGKPADGPGFFYPPTVLAGCTDEMAVMREETFGPAAAITRVKSEDEAIALANDTIYGLGASLWTRDIDRAKQLARRIESGSVFVNGMVASDPRLPFGGVKHSGYGRELSDFGIREFVNTKTVWLRY